MSVVNNKPIVIGGKDELGFVHGTVEIYDPDTGQWNMGPLLSPPRRVHSVVLINDTFLIVLGGFNGGYITSVKLLDTKALTWSDLNDLPSPRCEMACNVVDNDQVLCIGGEGPEGIVYHAISLDMTISNPVWQFHPKFDAPEPVRSGFVFQLDDFLFCMTLGKANFAAARTLRRINMTETNPTWLVVTTFPESMFPHVSPYITEGFKMQLS